MVAARLRPMSRRFFLVLFSWSGVACLLLFAIDCIPDTEQFDGIPVAASLPSAGNNLSLDSPISDSVAASVSALSVYLSFLLRSPPSLAHFASRHFSLRDPSAPGRLRADDLQSRRLPPDRGQPCA